HQGDPAPEVKLDGRPGDQLALPAHERQLQRERGGRGELELGHRQDVRGRGREDGWGRAGGGGGGRVELGQRVDHLRVRRQLGVQRGRRLHLRRRVRDRRDVVI